MTSNCLFLAFRIIVLAQRLEISAPHGVLNSLSTTLGRPPAGTGPDCTILKQSHGSYSSTLDSLVPFSHCVACGCLFAIWSFLVVTLVAKTAIALTSGSVLGKPSMMRVSSGSLMASSTFFHCFDAM